MRRKLLSLCLCCTIALAACTEGGGGPAGPSGTSNTDNNDDVGLTMLEVMGRKDFVGPDNVPAASRNIFVGVKQKFRVFAPGEEVEYFIVTGERQSKALNVTVSLENGFTGFAAQNTHKLFTGREKQSILGRLRAGVNGILTFRIQMKDDAGAVVMDQSTRLAVMPQAAGPTDDDFLWGVQPFLIRSIEYGESAGGDHCFLGYTPEETYELVWRFIDRTGANLVRDGTVWTSNQPLSGGKNFALMDRLVADAGEKGYLVDWHLGGTPDWAVTERFQSAPVKWNKPPSPAAWQQYIDLVSARYAGKSHVIMEIINECNWPDFFYGSAAEYVDLFDASMKTFRAVSPDTVVINGGMVMPQANNFVTEESEKFRFKEDGDYYDCYRRYYEAGELPYIAYHSHAAFRQFVETDAVNMMYYLTDRGIPRNEIFLNESGLFQPDGLAQAEEVLKKALWTKGNNNRGFVLFNFRDIEGGELSPPGWGVITRDGQPKEMYVAYATAIRMLSRYHTVHTYANTLYNAYLMENGERSILLTFCDKSVPEGGVTLPAGIDCTAYDMFGNPIAEGFERIGTYPVYLVFEGKVDPASVKVTVPNGYQTDLAEYGRIDNFPN